jgi:hypothetical protein
VADATRVRKLEVACHIGLHMSTIREWKDAIAGDAASAIGIVLRMKIPDEITYPVDARMTLLLHNALRGSDGAALAMAHVLRKMPLGAAVKNRLAMSWLVRNLHRAGDGSAAPTRGRLRARRSIAAQLLGKPERES